MKPFEVGQQITLKADAEDFWDYVDLDEVAPDKGEIYTIRELFACEPECVCGGQGVSLTLEEIVNTKKPYYSGSGEIGWPIEAWRPVTKQETKREISSELDDEGGSQGSWKIWSKTPTDA